MNEYDYVIVGAGSAGCILAARLSEDPDVSVCLLEAGPSSRSISIRMPAALGVNAAGGRFNWSYKTQPQPQLDNRQIFTPRGRVLGGSSSINGIVYVRGHPADYDRWSDEGATGWSADAVQPWFRRVEQHATRNDALRGQDGPVRITTLPPLAPLDTAFLDAGATAGYPATPDINGAQQEGFGQFDMNVDHGERASTAHAYLFPALSRPNLTVQTGVLCSRILLHNTRASGVEYLKRGRPFQVTAAREVIVCAGAINTPQLLMLSGIGPADHLRQHGIDVQHNLPGVGENLQDHLEVHLQYACPPGASLNAQMRPHHLVGNLASWMLKREGHAVSNGCRVGAFLRSRPDVPHPDVQIHFFPVYLKGWVPLPRPHGFRIGIGTLRATSRGRVTLASQDPRQPPLIDPAYLTTPEDIADLRACVRIGQDLARQTPFDGLRGKPLTPTRRLETDADIDAFVRATAESAYHVSCTCRMGEDDGAVTDPQARVRGLEGLRIVDASIMPSITSGNLNAPVMMMAEKIAHMIVQPDEAGAL